MTWPSVRLGEVIAQRKQFMAIADAQEYKRCRVQLHAQGIVERDRVLGAMIKTKQQQVCKAGEFLVAEIDAKVGGFGIIPSELHGAIVSSHYFLFTVDSTRLENRFLDFFSKTPHFRDQVRAQGSTNYAAIRPDDVLNYTIPLPPLAEQRRIVQRIEELALKVYEARSLRGQTIKEVRALFDRSQARAFKERGALEYLPLKDVAVLERGKFSHRPRNDPRFFEGHHPWIQIAEIERADKFIRNHSVTLNDDGLAISKKFPRGTVLVSIAATIGAVGILDFDCCVPDSIVGITPREGTEAEFLYHFLGYARAHLEDIAPQSAQKNINLQILGNLPVPKLTIGRQREIVLIFDELKIKVDFLTRHQAETALELAALLPSILDKAFKGEM
jgi:type I restriction enzyme S subunit